MFNLKICSYFQTRYIESIEGILFSKNYFEYLHIIFVMQMILHEMIKIVTNNYYV